jgi:hypothetical protein
MLYFFKTQVPEETKSRKREALRAPTAIGENDLEKGR